MPLKSGNYAKAPRRAPRSALRWAGAGAALCFTGLFCAPASAVTLRQQWQAGQQLTYETSVNGTLTLLDDDESPQPWAGLPIDFKMRGGGALTFDTQSVDEQGIATLLPIIGDTRVRGQGFGEVLELTVKDNVISATLNGKPVTDADVLQTLPESQAVLRFSPEGRLEGVAAIKKETKEPDKPNDKPDNKPKTNDLGVDWGAAAQSWFLRALPPLWPAGDVKIGGQWTAPFTFTFPLKTNGTPPKAPLHLGQMTFTLRGEEEVAGRKTQRVALSGEMNLDAANAKILNEAARENAPKPKADPQKAEAPKPEPPKAGSPKTAPGKALKKPSRTSELSDAKQKISGDLWLDAASGQLVRVEVMLQSHIHSKGTITNKAGRTRPTETWADFDGSIQMQLRRVSYASR